MYYKVLKNNKVIDVLDQLIFLRHQKKHNIMVICEEAQAQAILSSDKNTIWHEESLYKIPVDGFDTVRIESIDAYEYKQLKALGGKTPEEIYDAVILSLIEEGIL